MNEIIDYTVLNLGYNQLISTVKRYIKLGWIPFGAPFFDPNAPQNICQALIAYAPNKNNKEGEINSP